MARVATLVFLICTLAACQQDLGVWVPHTDQRSPVYPGVHWNKAATPEQLGWSSKQLATARTFARQIGSAAVMIVHRGIVIDAWGDMARKYRCHSIRKSLLSALIGIQVHAGTLTLSHTLADMGIDDNAPSLTTVEKQATVADLLKSRSGVYHTALYQTAQAKARRPERGSHLPGTYWYYNNWDFNVLGTLFEQAAKQTIFAAFKHQIAVPLQMEDYQISDGRYVTGSDSIHPAYPFRMSTRDLARFGLLFLRHGRWRDTQVVPAAWVNESIQPYTQTGYG